MTEPSASANSSTVAPMPTILPPTDATRPSSPNRSAAGESTALASDASIHAPDEPTQWNGRKNFRNRRHRSIPGWFDRYEPFGRRIQLPNAIANLVDDAVHACCRRTAVQGIAAHMTLIAGGVALLTFIPEIADALKGSVFGQSDAIRFALFCALMGELVLLKLVFDLPRLRRFVFTMYTMTLVLLFASTTLAFDAPFAWLSFAIMTIGWWLMWLLSGVQYKGAFLSWTSNGMVAFAVVIALMATALLATPDDDAKTVAAIGMFFEGICRFLGAAELDNLYMTVPPEEASLAVYYVNFDILAGGFMQPLCVMAFMMFIAIVFGVQLAYLLVKFIVLAPLKTTIECLGMSNTCADVDCNLGLVKHRPRPAATSNEEQPRPQNSNRPAQVAAAAVDPEPTANLPLQQGEDLPGATNDTIER